MARCAQAEQGGCNPPKAGRPGAGPNRTVGWVEARSAEAQHHVHGILRPTLRPLGFAEFSPTYKSIAPAANAGAGFVINLAASRGLFWQVVTAQPAMTIFVRPRYAGMHFIDTAMHLSDSRFRCVPVSCPVY